MSKRLWTAEDIAELRRLYGKCSIAEICRTLGRTENTVRQHACKFGLSKLRPDIHGAPLDRFIVDKNKLGWSDREIAVAWGDQHNWTVCPKTVTDRRNRLGLSSNARNARYRQKIADCTREQCRTAGAANLAAVRVKLHREYAHRNGWPEDLRPRAVQILNALYDRGPMTRREIAAAVEMRWKDSQRSLRSRDQEGSYLAHLLGRGLVVAISRGHRVVGAGGGRGQNVYMIPLTVKRGDASTWPATAVRSR